MKGDFFVNKVTLPLRAACYGAFLFDIPIIITEIAWRFWKSGHMSQAWYGFFRVISVFLSIPSAVISSEIGFKGGLVNEYLVNGLVGAAIFGFLALVWQFLQPIQKGEG